MKRFLALEDGTVFEGESVSLQANFPEKAGEVVFNTSHSGYEEIATDPSYFNQIVVMTAPMQGNYGAEPGVWESKKIWINGFVALRIQNTKRNNSWVNLLNQHQVPMLQSIDTRELTLKLRQSGTLWGALVAAANQEEAILKAKKLIEQTQNHDTDWVFRASRSESELRPGKKTNGPKVAVLDFGAKENILKELQSRTSQVQIFPSRTPVEKILEWNPDSIMLTNGPGDPSLVKVAVDTVRSLIGKKPIFGICMGHQILALALNAKTYKLRFGHRGANHPIRDQLLGMVYISSQNHGYAVDENTLPEDVQVTHRNLNDNTVAGFYSKKLNCLGIQYHPESRPGPHDAVKLFDFFINNMHQTKKEVPCVDIQNL